MPKISIIVPVYNSEKYIESCLKTLTNQSMQDLEIIIVDDGSTDRSSSIIKNYMLTDNRIKYTYQINKGPGSARYKGIDLANGEFIAFVDSDDWIEPEMYKEMIGIAISNELYVVICNYSNDYTYKNSEYGVLDLPENVIIKKGDFSNFIYKEMMEDGYFNCACNKIYRKDFISKIKQNIANDIDYGEDLIFQLEVFDKLDKTYYINKYFYHYVHREKSLTTMRRVNMINNIFVPMYKIRKQYAAKWGINDNDVMKHFIYYCLMDMISTLKGKSYFQKKKIIKNNYISSPELFEAINKTTINDLDVSIKIKVIYFIMKFQLAPIIAILVSLNNLLDKILNQMGRKNL